MREGIAACRTWVVKIGSSLLTNEGIGLDRDAIAGWAAQIVKMRGQACGWWWSLPARWRKAPPGSD